MLPYVNNLNLKQKRDQSEFSSDNLDTTIEMYCSIDNARISLTFIYLFFFFERKKWVPGEFLGDLSTTAHRQF